MKVKDVIKILEEFNPEAEFRLEKNVDNPIQWFIEWNKLEDKKQATVVFYRIQLYPVEEKYCSCDKNMEN